MNKFVLGIGGVLAATTGFADEAVQPDQEDSKMATFLSVIQGQHVVRDVQMPTQEEMTFEQLDITGKAFSSLTLAINNSGDVDAAANGVLGSLKGIRRIDTQEDLDVLKDRIIGIAEAKGTGWLPQLADPNLEDQFGWHSGTRAMTCFHEKIPK